MKCGGYLAMTSALQSSTDMRRWLAVSWSPRIVCSFERR
jgi:hypothetical protein